MCFSSTQVFVDSSGGQLFLTFTESIHPAFKWGQELCHSMLFTSACLSYMSFLPPPRRRRWNAYTSKRKILQTTCGGEWIRPKLKRVLLIFWFSAERCREHLESYRVFPWEDLSPRHGSYQLSPHQRNSSQLLIRCQNSLPLPPITWHRPWCIAKGELTFTSFRLRRSEINVQRALSPLFWLLKFKKTAWCNIHLWDVKIYSKYFNITLVLISRVFSPEFRSSFF